MEVKHYEGNGRLSLVTECNGVLHLTGRTCMPAGDTVAEQAAGILKIIDETLQKYGSDKKHILFTQVFLKDIIRDFNLDDKAFRYFNVKTNRWEVEGGTYELRVGASATDIGSPFAFGGVAGRKRANIAAIAATAAPQASGIDVPSISASKRNFAPSAKTAAQTQPSEPKTLMLGNASGVLLTIAIEDVSPQVGIYAHIARHRKMKIAVGLVVRNVARSNRATSALSTKSTFSLLATLSANIPTIGEKIEPIAIVDIISANIVPVTCILSR